MPRMKTSIVWLRRDLRLGDNTALYEACRHSERVCIAFVISPALLKSPSMGAPLVTTFFQALSALRDDLRTRGSDLAVLCGDFATELCALAKRIDADAVYFNEDYEPHAIRRDASVEAFLHAREIQTHAYTDHVYFSAYEVLQNGGAAYRVFTPYKRRWLDLRSSAPRLPWPSLSALKQRLLPRELIGETRDVPAPEDFGFAARDEYPHVGEALAQAKLRAFLGGPATQYKADRNYPALEGTSHLSPDLRAGTIGIRTCVEDAFAEAQGCTPVKRDNVLTWVSELIWRDFYQMILKQYPHVEAGPFLPAAERIPWQSSHADFLAWCDGRTGYPIVDAAMRQLNATGWMHNRLRMIVASFLTKHLLIDWRQGERYFESHLADADVAQNNGGWQWAASTGTDAAPYFRIFNPTAQGKQFDPTGTFVKRMIPELRAVPVAYVHEPWLMPPLIATSAGVVLGTDYPVPIVDHQESRQRAITTFANALKT